MVQVEHRDRPRPIGSSVQAGRVAQLTPCRRTACTEAEANWRFLQAFFWGGGARFWLFFADSWASKKTGVSPSCHGPNHGHKILVHEKTTSLRSVS